MRNESIIFGDIFTPNDTPTITYVGRDELNLEGLLKSNCKIPKMVVSISGPSKSGKTVLIKKVIDEDLIIPVIGSGMQTSEDLWNRALQWMGTPSTVTAIKASETNVSGSAKGGGEVSVPLLGKGKAEARIGSGKGWSASNSESINDNGLIRIIKEIGDSDFIILIDDFHYIPEIHREEIGRQIKVAIDNGVKIITASAPHRTDDVVRSNPELRGRVAAVDVGYWGLNHLKMIAKQGFDALNVGLPICVQERLSKEALGSPQLMQTICFCLCQVLGITEPAEKHRSEEINNEQIREALKRTSHFTDFSKMLSSLHSGPKMRGQERKEHNFTDGSTGDVYRSVLLAICSDPISMTFTYDNLLNRVKAVCTDNSPVGSSVTSCLEQMHSITENLQPGNPVLAWDGNTLDVTDPYFAFFSKKLKQNTKPCKLIIISTYHRKR